MLESELTELVSRALGGDQAAWSALVTGLSAIALRAARAYRLGEADARDVCQETWCALHGQLAALRDPARLPGWLATTARRQALRVLAATGRERCTAGTGEDAARHTPGPEHQVLRAERDLALWRAVDRLPERYRLLVRLLADRPELSHAQLAAELGIRPASVGRLRGRCFERIRRWLLAEGFGYP